MEGENQLRVLILMEIGRPRYRNKFIKVERKVYNSMYYHPQTHQHHINKNVYEEQPYQQQHYSRRHSIYSTPAATSYQFY